ncbi:MAG TPA: DUF5367 family protein [Blastocatellia bacterium]|nr:DUF5367 family protein [Blastocatellia bacterium]
MNIKLFSYGLAIWAVATLALRAGGQGLLHPGNWFVTVTLFAVSFVACALLVRRLCIRQHLQPSEWPAGAISVLLPTLVLDPFSSAFFPRVFPNIPPQAAGIFGGWMICCCAGALIGVMFRRQVES